MKYINYFGLFFIGSIIFFAIFLIVYQGPSSVASLMLPSSLVSVATCLIIGFSLRKVTGENQISASIVLIIIGLCSIFLNTITLIMANTPRILLYKHFQDPSQIFSAIGGLQLIILIVAILLQNFWLKKKIYKQ